MATLQTTGMDDATRLVIGIVFEFSTGFVLPGFLRQPLQSIHRHYPNDCQRIPEFCPLPYR